MPDEILHGTLGAYTNRRCRCSFCREAHADYMRVWRKAKNDLLVKGIVQVEHGRDSTYHNWLCRCQECRTAHARHEPEIEARKRWRMKVVVYRRAELHYGDVMEAKPDWAPQYLQPKCPNCTTQLVPVEVLSDATVELRNGRTVIKLAELTDPERWQWDEWMCPHCLDGVRFDWPPEKMGEIMDEARKQVDRYLLAELEYNYRGMYVAVADNKVVYAADEPRMALKNVTVPVDLMVYVPPEGYPVVAPVDVMAAFFRLEIKCPQCGWPILREEFTALFTITRSCPKCDYKDLWRVVVDPQ